MADITLFDIVRFMYTWAPQLLNLTALVLSVMTLAGRNKALRMLGAWGIACTVVSFLGNTTDYLRSLYDAGILAKDFYESGTYYSVTNILTVIVFAVWILETVFIWLYAKRSYGTGKGVLIAVIALGIASPVLQTITYKVLYRIDRAGPSLKYAGCVSLIFSIAVHCVFMYTFFKNRKKEKSIPAFWVYYLSLAIVLLISYLLGVGPDLYESGLVKTRDDSYMISMLIRVMVSFIFPAACLYLFIGSRKTTKTKPS